MKHSFFVLCFLFILFISSNSYSQQSGWFQQNSGTSVDLSHVYFVNANTGIMTSYSPVIFRSTDGGASWSQFAYPNSNMWFWGVTFVNETTGWVVGYSTNTPYANVILKTTNSGLNWTEQYQGNGQSREVFFLNFQTGWVGGEYFYKTTNAGTNWSVTTPANYQSALALFFLNENTGWIGGQSGGPVSISKTTDGGASWIGQLTGSHVYAIKFTSALTGFAAGPQGILKSSNGGNNWTIICYGDWGSSLAFTNAETGWGLVQYSNPLRREIMKTTNAGLTWVDQGYNDSRILNFIFMLSGSTGWTVGDQGAVYKTTNGGEPVGIQPVNNEVSNKFILSQNFPNPFNGSTKIYFEIKSPNLHPLDVEIKLYDIFGKEVAVLIKGKYSRGIYSVDVDASNLTSGVYFYEMTTGGTYRDVKKMVLIK